MTSRQFLSDNEFVQSKVIDSQKEVVPTNGKLFLIGNLFDCMLISLKSQK
jgi:hypothetical protein